MDLILDVNSDLYNVGVDDKLAVVLTRSLVGGERGGNDDGYWDPAQYQQKSLADDYEYVMFGKVYKFDENATNSKV
jgi:DNA-directed RNA polymerase I, II, and III subunit RPABC3